MTSPAGAMTRDFADRNMLVAYVRQSSPSERADGHVAGQRGKRKAALAALGAASTLPLHSKQVNPPRRSVTPVALPYATALILAEEGMPCRHGARPARGSPAAHGFGLA